MPRCSACNQSIDLAVCIVGNGVDTRTAETFQKRGKAAVLLSGSRIGPAYGRLWVETGMEAFDR